MEQLTPHFHRREFACKGKNCCEGSAPVDPRLAEALEELRGLVGVALTINSAFRCRRHNKAVGGAPDSLHTLAMAADVAVPAGWTPAALAAMAEQVPAFNEGGIGIYPAWVHLDVRRTGKARWQG